MGGKHAHVDGESTGNEHRTVFNHLNWSYLGPLWTPTPATAYHISAGIQGVNNVDDNPASVEPAVVTYAFETTIDGNVRCQPMAEVDGRK